MEIGGIISNILQRKGSGIYAIAPDATLYEAVQMMAEKNVGSLLVMSGPRLEGIISERDYTRKVVLKGRSSKDTLVREIMTRDVVTVGSMDTVEACMRLVTDRRIRHLPVVDEGEVSGIVSIGDLVRYTLEAQSAAIEQLHDYISGKYPG